MTFSLNKIWVNFFYVFIVVAFPLNFFYALFYVLGLAPSIPFIGYAIAVHLTSILILIFFITNTRFFLNIAFFYVLLFFLINVLVYTIVGYFLSDYAFNNEAFAQSILLFYYLLIYSVVGFGVYYFSMVGKNIWLYSLYFFLLTIIYLYFRNDTFSFYFDLMNPDVSTINYQEVSAIFLFVWYFYYSGLTKSFDRMKSIFILILLLLASGARSEFYGSILALSYVFFLGNIRINYRNFKTLISIFVLMLFIGFYFREFFIDIFENSRQFSVTDLSSDNSWQAREYLKQTNLNVIKSHPILGSYASHFEIGRGSYIHSILSAWQQYGLFGFLLFAVLLVVPFIVISITRIKTDNKNLDGVLFIVTFSLITALFVKSVYWTYFGLSIGSVLYFFWSNKTMLLRYKV